MTDPFNPETSWLHRTHEMLPQEPETTIIHMGQKIVPANRLLADAEACRDILGVGFSGSLQAIVYPGIHEEDVGAIAIFKLDDTRVDAPAVRLVENDNDEHTNVYRMTHGLPYVAVTQEALNDIAELSERRGSVRYVAGDVQPFGLGTPLNVGRGIGQFGSDELVYLRETSRIHLTLNSAINGDLVIVDHSTNGSTVIAPVA